MNAAAATMPCLPVVVETTLLR